MVKMTETIKLNVPITVDGKEITELTMRRPKVGDQMRHHENGEMTAEGTARDVRRPLLHQAARHARA